jgi:hypothetical protein
MDKNWGQRQLPARQIADDTREAGVVFVGLVDHNVEGAIEMGNKAGSTD